MSTRRRCCVGVLLAGSELGGCVDNLGVCVVAHMPELTGYMSSLSLLLACALCCQ